MLAFRDWLRTHDEDRDLYLDAKRQLATREWKYVQNYADAKSLVVEDIMEVGERILNLLPEKAQDL